MIVDFDERHDSLFVRFVDSEYHHSEETDDCLIDYDNQGVVIGFELFKARSHLVKFALEIRKYKANR